MVERGLGAFLQLCFLLWFYTDPSRLSLTLFILNVNFTSLLFYILLDFKKPLSQAAGGYSARAFFCLLELTNEIG